MTQLLNFKKKLGNETRFVSTHTGMDSGYRHSHIWQLDSSIMIRSSLKNFGDFLFSEFRRPKRRGKQTNTVLCLFLRFSQFLNSIHLYNGVHYFMPHFVEKLQLLSRSRSWTVVNGGGPEPSSFAMEGTKNQGN